MEYEGRAARSSARRGRHCVRDSADTYTYGAWIEEVDACVVALGPLSHSPSECDTHKSCHRYVAVRCLLYIHAFPMIHSVNLAAVVGARCLRDADGCAPMGERCRVSNQMG